MTAVAALCLALVVPLAAADAPLTNDDVMKLSKAGLSSETIVAKIRASATKFDTSADALVTLATAGVADAVIRAMVMKPSGVVVPSREQRKAQRPARTAASQTPSRRKRFEDISVAAPSGGRCEHATLELSANGIKTGGCHETNVNLAWKDVAHVCSLYGFRSTLVITGTAGERRIHTNTPADLKAIVEAIRAFAPSVREETVCR